MVHTLCSGAFEAEFSQVAKSMQGYVDQLRSMTDSATRLIHDAIETGQKLQQKASTSHRAKPTTVRSTTTSAPSSEPDKHRATEEIVSTQLKSDSTEVQTSVAEQTTVTEKSGAENAPDERSDPKPGNLDGTLVVKNDAPLFARLGGDPAIDIVVDSIYTRIVDDPRISRFYADVDIANLKASYKSYLGAAFGGPVTYSGRPLSEAHASLVADGLDGSHFDVVVQHLRSVLIDFQVDSHMIDEIMEIIDAQKAEILR